MKWMVYMLLTGAIGYFIAAVVWPWWGPHVVVPCPIATPLGCWLTAIAFGLQGLGWGLKK